MWMFNTSTLGWKQIISADNQLPSPRLGHSFTLLGGKFYVFGGVGELGSRMNDLWEFDLNTLHWRIIIDPLGGKDQKVLFFFFFY
jgi:hypothetical protein